VVAEHKHPSALELADAIWSGEPNPWEKHLMQCLECRVRATRLLRASGAAAAVPDTAALERVLGADTQLPAGVLAAVKEGPVRQPAVGELWRAGADEAVLVWVRAVREGAIAVMPVVLDVDMADEATLLLPVQVSPFNMELAVITSLRSLVHPEAFLTFVAELPVNVTAWTDEVLAASEEDRRPENVAVGSLVTDPNDQRIEYQQTLADVMADLAPAAWMHATGSASIDDTASSGALDGAGVVGGRDDVAEELFALLSQELPQRHQCAVHRALDVNATLTDGTLLRAVARISFADSSVLVALLNDWHHYDPTQVALACGRLLVQEAGARAVAVCTAAQDWSSVIISHANTRAAVETPSGRAVSPWVGDEALHVVDALAKHLDLQAPAWDSIDDSSLQSPPDFASVAQSAAASAITAITAEGQRSRTPAKKQAVEALSASTAGDLVDFVRRIAAGEEINASIGQLLKGGSR
jgi:hypothetical protein